MNDVIRKLMEQTGYVAPDLAPRAHELIGRVVAECIHVIEPSEEHRRDASWGFLGGEEGVELLDGKIDAIKQHFGLI